MDNYGTLEQSTLHLLRMTLYDKRGHSFGHFRSVVPAVSTPSFLPTPVCSCCRQSGKKEILMLFQALLSNIKMWACCLLVRPKEEHKQTALKMGNSVLARPSTICQSKTPFWAITSIRVITDEGIFGQCG